jgi:adenylate cyclase
VIGGAVPSIVAWGLLVVAVGLLLVLWTTRRELARLRERLEKASMTLQQLQLSFSRFAPQEVVERIIARGIGTTAEKKEVTVLFADLVGFTAMSESLDPDVLCEILNGYFARMSRAITEHQGHVSKFIGDGILALFGALGPNPWQADDAVHAALGMQAALDAYNRELASLGRPTLRLGIGVHRGLAVAGIVGSDELMEFTVIGNTVNLAARVEHLTRHHGVGVLVTREVRDAIDPRFSLRELPPALAPGVSGPVVTYAVEGFDGAASRS